jgi:hypothetical protein
MKSDLCGEMHTNAPELIIMLKHRVLHGRQEGYSIDEIRAAWRGTVTIPSAFLGWEKIDIYL